MVNLVLGSLLGVHIEMLHVDYWSSATEVIITLEVLSFYYMTHYMYYWLLKCNIITVDIINLSYQWLLKTKNIVSSYRNMCLLEWCASCPVWIKEDCVTFMIAVRSLELIVLSWCSLRWYISRIMLDDMFLDFVSQKSFAV